MYSILEEIISKKEEKYKNATITIWDNFMDQLTWWGIMRTVWLETFMIETFRILVIRELPTTIIVCLNFYIHYNLKTLELIKEKKLVLVQYKRTW